ncbi:hypothetical protein [Microvirga pudoricolor]|uniref:hypothetical protein n=1 Tax=Microvirga pudoricolor TaxID=2778729 RepID=UPI0019515FDC|nr:hypothetical protein [Microvirga pudoricolor]MBM6595257.1 hypothetical protein [Microvirga pudoricolor]
MIDGLVAINLSEMALANHVSALLADVIGMVRIGLLRPGIDFADDGHGRADRARMSVC